MSDDQTQQLLERLLVELKPHIRLLSWILGGVVTVLTAVVGGTIAVVMFVAEVRSGVTKCAEDNTLQGAALTSLDREQRELGKVVYQHIGGAHK